MMPKVLLLGRPNVGKSTLFNRLIRSKRAITHDRPGVTRDRMEGVVGSRSERPFTLVDTGGVTLDGHHAVAEGPEGIRGFEAAILRQAETALAEADVVCLVVDARDGLTPFDEHLAAHLRRFGKPVLLVVNKVDGAEREDELTAEFHGLGFPLLAVSAEHGHNIRALEDEMRDRLPSEPDEPENEGGMEALEAGFRPEQGMGKSENSSALADKARRPRPAGPLKLCLLGRPNAGKSSLTNKLTNNDRSIVSNVAGTTRDAIDTMVEHEGQFYTIVDTAGLRKKSVIDEDVEYYGFVRAMRAIDRAEVVLLVIDSTIGLTDQDQRVAGMAAERGCAMVVVLNKWDLVEGPDAKAEVRERIEDRLKFVGYAPVIAISALSGKNVQRIWGAINEAHANYSKSISTSRLNNWLQDIREFGHNISKGKRILKLKYVTQTGVQPPFFTFFCNHPDLVEPSFERYLENRLRSTFDFTGTPINLKFKKKD